jgi:hypothetical protein
MSDKRGCLKIGLFGCLGIFVIFTLMAGGVALVAWNHSGNIQIEDKVLTPEAAVQPSGSTEVKGFKETDVPAGVGLVILNLAGGENFEIHRGKPGTGVRVEANYDSEAYLVEDFFESRPDSSWVYGVRTKLGISGLHNVFRKLMGSGHSPRIDIYLPPDVKLALKVYMQNGGIEGDLGGLWLSSADLRVNKGGLALEVSRPLREPMQKFVVKVKSGGFALSGLGNASPRVVDVTCRFGGVSMDLDGAWACDSDLWLDAALGGIAVSVPSDVQVLHNEETPVALEKNEETVSMPQLRFKSKSKWLGDVKIDQ